MKDITIIDFNDSFTYNLATEISSQAKKIKKEVTLEVVAYKSAIDRAEEFLEETCDKKVIVWGPGPGHPEDYLDILPVIGKMLKHDNVFNLGVCLGHQLIWMARGFETVKSNNPMHGGRIEIKIPKWEKVFPKSEWDKSTFVQRYNSLVVDINPKLLNKNDDKIYFFEGECIASNFERTLTYQFHPESIGTSFPSLFLAPIFDFLYNK